MVKSHILGFPRIGRNRDLKKAVEAYWKGSLTMQDLIVAADNIKKENWQLQKHTDMDFVTVGDFAYYDHILNLSASFGVIPERFGHVQGSKADLNLIFRMGRGRAPVGKEAEACEMTKWFDTNYHYIVPEFTAGQTFQLSYDELFSDVKLAKAQGHRVKAVLTGPLTYLYLGKCRGGDFDKLTLLPRLLEVYSQIIGELKVLGVEWLQADEPILSLDLEPAWKNAFKTAYSKLCGKGVKILLTNYFGYLADNLDSVITLPVDGLHIDAVRGKKEVMTAAEKFPADKVLSVGIVEGRNIWKNPLDQSLTQMQEITALRKGEVWVASSCSLMHSPVSLDTEIKLNADLKARLAFAAEKCEEIRSLKVTLNNAKDARAEAWFNASAEAKRIRESSPDVYREDVRKRVAMINDDMTTRKAPYAERRKEQSEALGLPLFPTTTIGSFPQTDNIRKIRNAFKKGTASEQEYIDAMKAEIKLVIDKQEKYDLDVFVHGEPERNDMVEYFGELLSGFAFTENGWVQSYGSRCVKPPIIYGDVRRPNPMTVDWAVYAQSLTQKPVKGMLTGPITILCWSFVRNDISRKEVSYQIALALRDEVKDLENAGITVIQIDEPAIREGLPLRKAEHPDYLKWSVRSFHIAADTVKNSTQIHTHMCYSEFNEMIDRIAALDADVISIEASRSNMELLTAFETFNYPNEIGPGVYDIHSPIVPETNHMVEALKKAAKKISADRLWVNPDCGLKTRGWPETDAAMERMVQAAKQMRTLHGR